MADRKKKHAYLDDFEKDLNGSYHYRGAHYRYSAQTPRGQGTAAAVALLRRRCGADRGGGRPARGHGARALYLLVPYMAALVAALYTVVLLVRMTRGGARLRAYIHEQTAQKIALFLPCVGGAERRGGPRTVRSSVF